MLNMTDLKTRLGLPLTGDFIETTLGIPPRERDKRALLWAEDDYPVICDRLAAYVIERKGVDPLFG